MYWCMYDVSSWNSIEISSFLHVHIHVRPSFSGCYFLQSHDCNLITQGYFSMLYVSYGRPSVTLLPPGVLWVSQQWAPSIMVKGICSQTSLLKFPATNNIGTWVAKASYHNNDWRNKGEVQLRFLLTQLEVDTFFTGTTFLFELLKNLHWKGISTVLNLYSSLPGIGADQVPTELLAKHLLLYQCWVAKIKK